MSTVKSTAMSTAMSTVMSTAMSTTMSTTMSTAMSTLTKTPVFILHHIKLSHTVSYPVMLSYKVFTIMKDYLESQNLEIYDIIDFILLQEQKDKIIDEKSNYKLTDIEIKNIYLNAVKNMMSYIENNDVYNGIVIGVQPYGFDPLFRPLHYEIFRKHNFKLFLWMDDLHAFNRNINMPDDAITLDHRLDKVDYILTPSYNYYRNIKSPYLSKSIFYFYCLNENWFNDLPTNNFRKRTNKILISGASGNGYPLRNYFREFYSYNIKLKAQRRKSHALFPYIDYLQHPGYDRLTNGGKTGLDYLKILNSYRGAFFGFLKHPLDHPLAKIIEILGSGTLGFFEYHPILEEQLGLIKFVHYVPILVDKTNKPIFDVMYYQKYLNEPIGEQIMLAGCKYVREKFTMKKKCDEIVKLIISVKS